MTNKENPPLRIVQNIGEIGIFKFSSCPTLKPYKEQASERWTNWQ